MTQASSTDLIWEENTNMTHLEIDQMVDDYLGVSEYHVLPDPLGEYIKHIDCWGKFLSENKVLIGSVPQVDPRYNDFEFVAEYFANTLGDWGVPYEVYRVYTPGDDPSTPYTNSLILNKKVFVPVTGSTYDAGAIAAYEEAMPGYEVIAVMYNTWANTDALHCRTKGIADIGMLKITHMSILGNVQMQDQYDLTAEIRAYSGSALHADSLLLYYKTNGGPYQPAIMILQSGNLYHGMIPYQENGSVVNYYIHAADESGRSANHPFIGAPDPHEFTVVQLNPGIRVEPDTLVYTTFEQCIDGQKVRIYPEGDEDAIIDHINQEETDEFYWWSEPVVTFPYNLAPGDSLILTVYIGIVVDNYIDFVQDTMFIQCDAGDHEVLIMVDEDIISHIVESKELISIRAVYPNPFDNRTNININLQHDQHVKIDILDVRGNLITSLANRQFKQGEHHLQWDGSKCSAGIYYVIIRGDQFIGSAKMIKR